MGLSSRYEKIQGSKWMNELRAQGWAVQPQMQLSSTGENSLLNRKLIIFSIRKYHVYLCLSYLCWYFPSEISIVLPFFQGPPWLPCGSWTWPALFRPSERRIRSQKSLRRNLYGTAGQFFNSGSVNLGLYPWGISMQSGESVPNFPDEIGEGHHNQKQTHFADRFEAFAAVWARWSVLRSTGLWTILDLCFNVKGIHWKATHQSSSIFQIHYSRFSQGEGWSRRLLTAKQPIRNVRSSGNPFPVELSSKQPGKKPVGHMEIQWVPEIHLLCQCEVSYWYLLIHKYIYIYISIDVLDIYWSLFQPHLQPLFSIGRQLQPQSITQRFVWVAGRS